MNSEPRREHVRFPSSTDSPGDSHVAELTPSVVGETTILVLQLFQMTQALPQRKNDVLAAVVVQLVQVDQNIGCVRILARTAAPFRGKPTVGMLQR